MLSHSSFKGEVSSFSLTRVLILLFVFLPWAFIRGRSCVLCWISQYTKEKWDGAENLRCIYNKLWVEGTLVVQGLQTPEAYLNHCFHSRSDYLQQIKIWMKGWRWTFHYHLMSHYSITICITSRPYCHFNRKFPPPQSWEHHRPCLWSLFLQGDRLGITTMTILILP